VKGTFEFTEQGELRLDFSAINPNLATLSFKKVSNLTSLPPKTVIFDGNKAGQKARQSEAKTYIGAMVRAQQSYYIENNKFSRTINQLGLGMPSSTKYYNYRVLPQGNGTQKVMMTASAKDRKLRSYTGAVLIVKINGKNEMIRGICETNKPSLSPPGMPKISSSKLIQCPVGSKLLY
jgi:Tfp pilus assembly protein PilE